jgi:hypothetical protein
MTKKLNIAAITNELEGSAFFPSKPQETRKSRITTPPPQSQQPVRSDALEAQKKSERDAHTNPQIGKDVPIEQFNGGKFDKYSTYLRPGYKKILKSISLERECKDYEVLDQALEKYFDSLKK